MGRRLFLFAVALMAAASFRAASFETIPRYFATFGIQETPGKFILRYYWPPSSAPFPLGHAAAIHLGNTRSCIAGYGSWGGDPGSVYRFCIPSWVSFISDKEGAFSGDATRDLAALIHGTAIAGFTLLTHQRPEEDPWVKQQDMETDQVFSPQYYLAGVLMSELKRMAEAHLGREIQNAVITVPRHVTYDERRRVEFAGTSLAGFQIAKVVDDQQQIAGAVAAHGHHTEQGDGKVVLVLHVGECTSHATLFKFVEGKTTLIRARDDLFLGGDDFTARVVDHMVELVKQQHGVDIRHDRVAMLRLTAECERAKESLSERQEAWVWVRPLADGVDLFSARLTRAKFEELNRDLFERVTDLVDQVVTMKPPRPRPRPRVVVEERGGMMLRRLIDEAAETVTGRSRDQAESHEGGFVDDIVVARGSVMMIPKIRELVEDYFFRDREPANGVEEPDKAGLIDGAVLLTRSEPAGYLERCFNLQH